MKYHFKTKDKMEASRMLNATEAFNKLWDILQALKERGALSDIKEEHREFLLDIIDSEFINNNFE